MKISLYPDLPVPYTFGTRGRSLPDKLAAGSNSFQMYRELEEQEQGIILCLDCDWTSGTYHTLTKDDWILRPLPTFAVKLFSQKCIDLPVPWSI